MGDVFPITVNMLTFPRCPTPLQFDFPFRLLYLPAAQRLAIFVNSNAPLVPPQAIVVREAPAAKSWRRIHLVPPGLAKDWRDA